MMSTVLIIEDEIELVRVLKSYLEQVGLRVLSSQRGDSGLALYKQNHPDLVILDLNLPGLDGLDVAREIRKMDDTPILMLTARVEEIDQLIGLEIGADDYITKPFSPRIVVARVKSLLRRARHATHQQKLIKLADLEIDLNTHDARIRGDVLNLTPTEFTLLAAMAAHPGQVFTRLQLLEMVQGMAYEGYERTIDAHIKNLRSKIEADTKKPRYIETVFGIGYRFSRDMDQ